MHLCAFMASLSAMRRAPSVGSNPSDVPLFVFALMFQVIITRNFYACHIIVSSRSVRNDRQHKAPAQAQVDSSYILDSLAESMQRSC